MRADEWVCPTCHGTGRLPSRWHVLYRSPTGNGTGSLTNGAGGFIYDEARSIVEGKLAAGILAWMEPVNEGYPARTEATR